MSVGFGAVHGISIQLSLNRVFSILRMKEEVRKKYNVPKVEGKSQS
jgi:hypothetical protein